MIIDKNFSPLMESLFAKKSLSSDEIEAFVHAMVEGTLSEVRIASVLTALRSVQLSSENLLTVAHVMRSFLIEMPPAHSEIGSSIVVDCCGTGGGKRGMVNISTQAALLAASAGAVVAKLTGKSLGGRSGSGSVLRSLGIAPAESGEEAQSQLAQQKMTFLDAASFYPDFKDLSDVRKTLGFKTIVDLVFPLLNPFPLSGQLVGVYADEVIPLLVEALKNLGRRRALVVHGEDGADEISVCAPTRVSRLEQGRIAEEIWKPEDFGFERYHIHDLQGHHVEQNAQMVEKVLEGKAPPAIQSAAVLNAGAVVWCAEACASVEEGVRLVQAAIERGAGKEFLKTLVK